MMSWIRMIFIGLFLSLGYLEGGYEHHLSVTMIFRDEAPYLREWIEYHRMLGVDHFYLYNNLSQDHYQEVLNPYISQGIVELIQWPYDPPHLGAWDKIQIEAYQDAFKRAKKRTKWLAIIDSDEYLVPVQDLSLTKLLGRYESDKKIGGICIPWVFFGTSHVTTIPQNKLLIETLLLNGGPAAGGNPQAIWQSGSYKSIVRPKYVDQVVSPHYCTYRSKQSHILVDFSTAQINHYWTRDDAFFQQVKLPRRQRWGQDVATAQQWANGMNQETSLGLPILKFVKSLRDRLGLTP
jgi:hypothetical protein